MDELQTIEDIITQSEDQSLYKKLIIQLNKDFLRAAVPLNVPEHYNPQALKLKLQETIVKLIQEQISEYLNLLYIIDVSEEKIKQVKGDSINEIAAHISYLILLREWKKVWIRSNMR